MTNDGELEKFGRNTLAHDGCSTCGDVAVPVKVIEVHGGEAVVEDRLGIRTTVAIDFVPGIKAGDILLVHMGVALGRALEVRL
jgi:hydrogenase expression/formation protein HypC